MILHLTLTLVVKHRMWTLRREKICFYFRETSNKDYFYDNHGCLVFILGPLCTGIRRQWWSGRGDAIFSATIYFSSLPITYRIRWGGGFGMGNWSYGFYPQFLGAIVSAIFMSVVSLFKDSPHALLFGARMASVLFATLAVFFVGKSIGKIFEKKKDRYVYAYSAALLFAMWPQVAFLAGYVNNDVVALCGVSMIIYASILGYKDKWNVKNSALLGGGFVMCLLGYSNSYGFVLFGSLYFMGTLLWREKNNKKTVAKLAGIVFAICLIVAGPFFLRNGIIYGGDILGMRTFKQEQTKWENEYHVKMQRNYTEVTGRGLNGLLVDDQYRKTQADSFIAKFGAMSISPSDTGMMVYKVLMCVGIIGFAWMFFDYLHQKKKVLSKNIKQKILFTVFVLASCVTTVALSLYYTLRVDYQPQGRYVIYIIIPLIIYGLYAVRFVLDKLIVTRYRSAVFMVFVVLYAANTVEMFHDLIMPL